MVLSVPIIHSFIHFPLYCVLYIVPAQKPNGKHDRTHSLGFCCLRSDVDLSPRHTFASPHNLNSGLTQGEAWSPAGKLRCLAAGKIMASR